MIINNAVNSPLPTSFALGGTNAALTASNGGIFYSTASAGAILGGTPTAKQSLLSGASAAPVWSTTTYPSIIPINEIIYSSSNNSISALPTNSTACLVTDNSGTPTWSSSMVDGQVIIGSTGSTPTASTLTAGTNVNIANGPGSIIINSTAGGGGNLQWIATRTASNNLSLNFDNQLNSNYIGYYIEIFNILPQDTSPGIQLCLRFGTDLGGYISTGYIYQISDINGNGANNAYPGYNGTFFNEVFLTYANNDGVSFSSVYGGVCGNIYLFITSGSTQVASGVSQMSYNSYNSSVGYVNTTCAFQQPAANFTSVQLLMSTGNIASGSAYLYGLTTN